MIPFGKSREVVIFDDKLYSRQNINLDMSPYRYLLITYVLFPFGDDHNSGMNNILLMDLSKKVDSRNVYTAANLVPYNIFKSDYSDISGNMGIGCTVNNAKSNLKVVFTYGNVIQETNNYQYYITKIVGIK